MSKAREQNVLVGTIMGDAHIAMLKSNARLEVVHCGEQKEYVFWKYNEFKKFTTSKPRKITIGDKRTGKTYDRWTFKTNIDKLFTQYHKIFYPSGRKIVPKNISDLLNTPLGLAVWFMDDGGRRNDCYGLFLNTLSFSRGEHDLLTECLKNNFSIESRLHWVQDGYRIYIPSGEAKRFCEIVHPHILPSMEYKLSYDPVTTSYAELDRARDRG